MVTTDYSHMQFSAQQAHLFAQSFCTKLWMAAVTDKCDMILLGLRWSLIHILRTWGLNEEDWDLHLQFEHYLYNSSQTYSQLVTFLKRSTCHGVELTL